ncbi:MAG: nucleotidyltransferase family protein [Candidatus Omnitrophica bacterium]|nr:nucleotidyltransferase family protein [Candidatus Omnitrophota bacterium]
MSIACTLKDLDVVVLCGGMGKRLQKMVYDRPKCMADINGKPFLDILINYVAAFGFRRFILCIGYMGDLIKQYFHDKGDIADILFSEEREPLGTAGAIKKAAPLIKSSPFLVMNGDSFCETDLLEFVDFHKKKDSASSMVVAKKIKHTDDYGFVRLDDQGLIASFNEKKRDDSENGYINSGIYIFEKDVLSKIPSGMKFSFEHDLFPALIKQKFYGYKTDGIFIDIGTAERYIEAKKIFNLRQKALL